MFDHKLPANIHEFVDKLALRKAHLQGDEIWCICPFHDDTVPKNFSINVNNGLFYCFACKASGSVIFLANKNGFTYTESQALWHSIRGEESNEIKFPPTIVDDFLIKQYTKNGVSTFALERTDWNYNSLLIYSVYSDEQGNPIIFIKNTNGQVLSIIVKYDNHDIPIIGNYWKEWGYFGGMDQPIYDDVIIVEGIWDAVHIAEMFPDKTVYWCGGTSITLSQLKYLERFRTIYFMFDGDKAGREARDYVHKYYSDKIVRTKYCGGYLDDPDKFTYDIAHDIFDKALSWEDYAELGKGKKKK